MSDTDSSIHKKNQRIFFALPIIGVKDFLKPLNEYFDKFPHILKTVPPDNYHITLKFLGETDNEIFKKINSDFGQIEINISPIKFKMQGLGAFPDIKRARVIWCGLDVEGKSIYEIQKIIEHLSGSYGFKKEKRRFSPHLTLARVRKNKKIPDDLVDYIAKNRDRFYAESFFNRITLFKSELRKDGPVYTELNRIVLSC